MAWRWLGNLSLGVGSSIRLKAGGFLEDNVKEEEGRRAKHCWGEFK